MLWQVLSSFHLYRWTKGEGTLFFKIEPSILGDTPWFHLFLSDGPIKLAHCKKKKKKKKNLLKIHPKQKKKYEKSTKT